MYPDLEELVGILNEHGVRYLIIGGYAVGFHAIPRATKDLDVYIDPTVRNIARLRAALVDFVGVAPTTDLSNPKKILMIGTPPQRVDILSSVPGVVSFARAWKKRAKGRFGRFATQYLSLADMIAAKTAAGRPQDLADLQSLERAKAYARTRRRKRVRS
jgi:predicted nucleotidyltransferase